jgi:hypothetical protein
MKVNKREYKRTELKEPIEIVIEEIRGIQSQYENVSVYIEEVSHSGIRFESSLDLELNEEIIFNLPSIAVRSLIKGRIAWKKDLGTGSFIYGLQIFNDEN